MLEPIDCKEEIQSRVGTCKEIETNSSSDAYIFLDEHNRILNTRQCEHRRLYTFTHLVYVVRTIRTKTWMLVEYRHSGTWKTYTFYSVYLWNIIALVVHSRDV